MIRNESYIPTIIFDMDDTLVDYDKAVREFVKRITSQDEPELQLHGDPLPSHLSSLRTIMWKYPTFWLDMEPLESGVDLVAAFERADSRVVFCSRAKHEIGIAWQEKATWIYKRFPGRTLLITSDDKSLVWGDVLVDDNLDNVDRWLHKWKDGLAVIPLHDRNHGFEHERAIYYTNECRAEDVVAEVCKQIIPF